MVGSWFDAEVDSDWFAGLLRYSGAADHGEEFSIRGRPTPLKMRHRGARKEPGPDEKTDRVDASLGERCRADAHSRPIEVGARAAQLLVVQAGAFPGQGGPLVFQKPRQGLGFGTGRGRPGPALLIPRYLAHAAQTATAASGRYRHHEGGAGWLWGPAPLASDGRCDRCGNHPIAIAVVLPCANR